MSVENKKAVLIALFAPVRKELENIREVGLLKWVPAWTWAPVHFTNGVLSRLEPCDGCEMADWARSGWKAFALNAALWASVLWLLIVLL